MQKVAIVILNFNGEDYLKQFLPTLIENSDHHQVIVADNASTDGSVSILKSDFPEVRLIQLPKNHGFAEGYNQALRSLVRRPPPQALG